MKTIKQTVFKVIFAGITALLVLFSGNLAKAQGRADENTYYIFYVPAVYTKNNTAYISEPCYYTNYNKCRNGYDFTSEARRLFSTYLKANYNDIFPNGTQNMITIQFKQHSTTVYLKSKKDAYDRITALKAEILSKNSKIILTNFMHNCD